MPKKVLMVTQPIHPIPPLKGAAVETWMYEVSKRLIGLEPHIVSISHPFYHKREYRDGIYFHRVHFSRIYKRLFQKITRLDPLSYPKRVARIVDKIKPTIIHMHNFTRWANTFVNSIDRKDVRLILHMHNEFPVDKGLEVDAFIGCSNFIVDSYRDTPLRAEIYSCIYNGVDIERFKPHWEVPLLREKIREWFGIKGDDLVVLFVGRVSPEKGVEHLIKTAFILKDERIKFVIAGEISKGRGERARYGEEMVRMAAPLKDRIIFTDLIAPSKIHLLYHLGDILVIPSNFNEPFPMVAIEAMATGLPVIARKKGGLKECIEDGENGLLIDGIDPATGIAERIELMSSKEERERLGRVGRKIVEERFSWGKIALDTKRFYSLIMEQ